MSRHKKRAKTRAEPQHRAASWLCSPDAYETLCVSGYTSLAHNPEIVTAVDRIARLVSSMTIAQWQNTEHGDIRVRDGLSEVIDIRPNPYMTRATLIHWIVKTLLLDGDGNCVVQVIGSESDGRSYIDQLRPIPPGMVSLVPDGWGYRIEISGVTHLPGSDVLHFVANPDANYPWRGTGYRVALRDVADNLKQAAATEKGFMASKWKPSIIVKVDALTEEFADPEGRKRLLSEYIETTEAGEPWLIPADQFSVETVKPLSLSDLAISDVVQLDKRTVAAILGVPPFVLGVGEFSKDAWNNFISATIMPLAKSIEQELTRGIILGGTRYFRFNSRSLYSYSITEMVEAGAEMVDRMAMRRNEWRDWVGLQPDPEMDELLALENYVPADRLGDQKKLKGGENDE